VIERIQRVLRVGVDGAYGNETCTAVGNWQARRGMKVTRRVGPDEWRRLGL
jgi:peptidoglycan hydrolase-like protein with peptidoglycan-binding domain